VSESEKAYQAELDTQSNYVVNSLPHIAKHTKGLEAGGAEQLLRRDNPLVTCQNNFRPFYAPHPDEATQLPYAEEQDGPRITSNLPYGSEGEACCQCNNPMQRFAYFASKGKAFLNPSNPSPTTQPSTATTTPPASCTTRPSPNTPAPNSTFPTLAKSTPKCTPRETFSSA